jgi:hypothetical protein
MLADAMTATSPATELTLSRGSRCGHSDGFATPARHGRLVGGSVGLRVSLPVSGAVPWLSSASAKVRTEWAALGEIWDATEHVQDRTIWAGDHRTVLRRSTRPMFRVIKQRSDILSVIQFLADLVLA